MKKKIMTLLLIFYLLDCISSIGMPAIPAQVVGTISCVIRDGLEKEMIFHKTVLGINKKFSKKYLYAST